MESIFKNSELSKIQQNCHMEKRSLLRIVGNKVHHDDLLGLQRPLVFLSLIIKCMFIHMTVLTLEQKKSLCIVIFPSL